MRFVMILTVGVCLMFSTAMVAQEAPKPGPEHRSWGAKCRANLYLRSEGSLRKRHHRLRV